jgi:DNA-directed RNA polymerase specialized sigma24 family protein
VDKPRWEEVLWAELDSMSDIDQVVTTGRWISTMREVLSALGDRRRMAVLRILALPDWDATRLAETIGTRRSTITRLAEEGRARLRRQMKDDTHPSPG